MIINNTHTNIQIHIQKTNIHYAEREKMITMTGYRDRDSRLPLLVAVPRSRSAFVLEDASGIGLHMS